MEKRKFVLSVCVAAAVSVWTVSAAFAAGLGVVDFAYLERQHPQFSQGAATYQANIQKYRSEFIATEKSKTDVQKRQMIDSYNSKLDKERVDLFGPIDQDVLKLVKEVSLAKKLDYVVAKGAVIIGQQTVDITEEVAAKVRQLKK